MNKSILHIRAVETAAAVLLAALALNSCTNGGLTPPETDSAEPVRISAEVSGELYSRAGYPDEGLVTDGTYYLTYPLNGSGDNLSWTVAVADFGKDGNDMGIVTTPQGNELKWSDVGGGAVPTFSLDNVPPDLDRNGNTDPTTVVFEDSNNPFVAAPFDDKDGSNDLLWGNKQVNRETRRIDFDLHHYMSRVRLVITADETNSQEGDLDLTGATVSISSLVLTPVSFNRLDGSLSLGDDPGNYIYKPLEFVNEDREWADTETDEDNDKKTVYTTRDFVLPPQGLLDDDRRPRLTISLQNGKKYSGILPHAMEVDYSQTDKKDDSYPVALAFLKEHVLTISTLITEEPPYLVFMPVTVREWVDKGEFSLEGHQAGIYNEQEFYDMIEYYQTNNEFQLARYGYQTTRKGNDGTDETIWVFNIWHYLELEEDKIKGVMVRNSGQADFNFNFNRYTVSLKDGEALGTEELKTLVTST